MTEKSTAPKTGQAATARNPLDPTQPTEARKALYAHPEDRAALANASVERFSMVDRVAGALAEDILKSAQWDVVNSRAGRQMSALGSNLLDEVQKEAYLVGLARGQEMAAQTVKGELASLLAEGFTSEPQEDGSAEPNGDPASVNLRAYWYAVLFGKDALTCAQVAGELAEQGTPFTEVAWERAILRAIEGVQREGDEGGEAGRDSQEALLAVAKRAIQVALTHGRRSMAEFWCDLVKLCPHVEERVKGAVWTAVYGEDETVVL